MESITTNTIVILITLLGAAAGIVVLKGKIRTVFICVLALLVVTYIGLLAGQPYVTYLIFLTVGFTFGYFTHRHLSTSICDVFVCRPQQSLEAELLDVQEVWFAWHSGTVKVAEGDLFKTPRNIRMILTKPGSPALKEIGKIANLTAEQMKPGIIALTSKVKEKGGKVKWFDGPIQNSIIIADPDTPQAWARVEFVVPFQDPASRPSIRVYKHKDSELFGRITKCFEDLWGHAKEPTLPAKSAMSTTNKIP